MAANSGEKSVGLSVRTRVQLGLAGALVVHIASRVAAEAWPSYAEKAGQFAQRIGVRPESGADLITLAVLLAGLGAVLGVVVSNKLASSGGGREVNAEIPIDFYGDFDEYDDPSVLAQRSPWGF